MIKALLVIEDSTTTLIDIEPDFAAYYELLGCTMLQRIFGTNWYAWCDEEGNWAGRAPNPAATALATELGWSGGGVLVGPVLFVTGWNQDADVPEEVIRQARLMGLLPEHD